MDAAQRARDFLNWSHSGGTIDQVELAELTAVIRDAQAEAIEEIADAFDVGTSVIHGFLHPHDVAHRIRYMAKQRRKT